MQRILPVRGKDRGISVEDPEQLTVFAAGRAGTLGRALSVVDPAERIDPAGEQPGIQQTRRRVLSAHAERHEGRDIVGREIFVGLDGVETAAVSGAAAEKPVQSQHASAVGAAQRRVRKRDAGKRAAVFFIINQFARKRVGEYASVQFRPPAAPAEPGVYIRDTEAIRPAADDAQPQRGAACPVAVGSAVYRIPDLCQIRDLDRPVV